MKSFILAGGFATRLWPLTEKRAKPLLPLAGRPLITHLVESIPPEIPITVSTNASFREGFEEWKAGLGRPVDLIIEDTTHDDHKLGALGALAQWAIQKTIDDDILLLTGDNYLGFSLSEFISRYESPIPLIAAHDIQDKEKASHFGTVITGRDSARDVVAFEEKPREPKTTLVSTGCTILPRQTLPILLEFARRHPDNVGGIFEEFLRRGLPVHCFTFMEPWLDIGSFASYLEAHRLLVGGKALVDSAAELIDSHCDGSVSVAPGSKVIRSSLRDSLIFEDCTIDDCMLRDCVIDKGCTLRGVDLSNKMIRAGTVLTVESYTSMMCP